MRDVGRIREKVEIVLDSRQVVSLVLASAVVLGIVFYLGVTVGKDLAAAQPAPPADPLEQLDRQAEALAEKLTFPEALTDEPAPAGAGAKAEAALAAADAQAAEKAAADKAAAEKAAAEKAAADKATAEKAAADKAAAEKAAAEKLAAEKAAAEKAKATAQPATGGGFTVQVGAMPARAEADALVAKLRSQGLAPYVVEADIPGKGTFYRVRLGKFRTRDEAKRYLDDVQRETRLTDGFVAQVDG